MRRRWRGRLWQGNGFDGRITVDCGCAQFEPYLWPRDVAWSARNIVAFPTTSTTLPEATCFKHLTLSSSCQP